MRSALETVPLDMTQFERLFMEDCPVNCTVADCALEATWRRCCDCGKTVLLCEQHHRRNVDDIELGEDLSCGGCGKRVVTSDYHVI